MKRLYLLILLLYITTFVYCQTHVTFPGEHYAPVSPQVAALGNYGNIPVNKYVGKPSISIPIYEINTGELQLPISLTYNYSGLKVTENPTRVGLGWFLDAGSGIITQAIRGVDDNGDHTGFGYSDTRVSSRLEDYIAGNSYAERRAYWRDAYAGMISEFLFDRRCGVFYNLHYGNQKYDTEPDVYQFNFSGHVGKFAFDKDNNIHLVPQKPLNITRTRTPHPQNEDYWTILDEKGTKYIFSKKEKGASTTTNSDGSRSSRRYSNSWLLNKIISPSKQDSIIFEYDYYANETYPSTLSQTRRFPGRFNGLVGNPTGIVNSYTYNSGTTHVLKRIIFKNGSVELVSGTTREDAENSWSKTLGNIIVKDARGTIIKNFEFDYGYWESLYSGGEFYNKRLYLKQIQQKNGNEILPPYKFTYIDDLHFPTRQPSMDNSGFGFYAQDYWGYYNGRSNSTLLPSLDNYKGRYKIENFSPANREPDPKFAKLGMLTKIEYPTGGHTEFEYEPHQYGGGIVGGLRIERMRDCSDFNNCITRRYTYTGGVLMSEKLTNIAETNHIYYSFDNCGEAFEELVVSSHTASPIEGIIIGYSKVETYFETESGHDNGKTIEYFTNKKYFVEETYGSSPFQSGYDFSWRRGQPLKIETYKRTGSSTYQLLQTKENEYNFMQDNEGLAGTLLRRLNPTDPNIYGLNLTVINGLQLFPLQENYLGAGYVDLNSANLSFNGYMDNHYHIISEWNYLTKSTVRVYDDETSKFMETVTNYFYDNAKHLQLSRTETTDSKGNTIVSKIYYPDDVNFLTGLSSTERNAVTKLNSNNLHRIAEPLQTETINNGEKFTQRTIYNNQKWSGLVVPEFIQTSKGSNNLEDRVVFYKYDITSGKLLEFSREDGIHIVYVWGYNNSHVIAKIENASYANLTPAQNTAIEDAKSISNFDVYSYAEVDLRNRLATLRREFPNAMVSTYTYDPLVGVTSITDPNGETFHYDYDNFHRLENISDGNGKILNKNTYNYKSH